MNKYITVGLTVLEIVILSVFWFVVYPPAGTLPLNKIPNHKTRDLDLQMTILSIIVPLLLLSFSLQQGYMAETSLFWKGL